MEAATVRERYRNARGLSVAATVSNPIGHHPYPHDSTRGSQTSLWGSSFARLTQRIAAFSQNWRNTTTAFLRLHRNAQHSTGIPPKTVLR